MATTIQPPDGDHIFIAPAAKRRPEGKNITIFDLPSDLIGNIFIRVPIKSMKHCTRVCRRWRNTILHPSFVNLLLSLLSPPSTLSLVIREIEPCNKFKMVNLVCDPLSLEVVDRECFIDPGMRFAGFCNGWICLSDNVDKVVLYSPTLGINFYLPSAPNDGGNILGLGFVYFPTTQQYKVVRISRNQEKKRNICYVYTGNLIGNGPNSWRRVCGGSRQPVNGTYQRSVFYDGAIIWLSDTRSDLIYFDIEAEKFGFVCFRLDMFQGCNGVGVLYDDKGIGHLYILDNPEGEFVHIWLMKDYKCLKSLDLKWTIKSPHFSTGRPVQLLKVLKDGRLLISLVSGNLACYNPKTRVLEEIRKSGFGKCLEALVNVTNM